MSSQCCGAGGGYKSQYNEFATNIAAKRIKEAVSTGAERIITTCPFCVLNLQQGAKQIGADIKVMDLAELLVEATNPVEAAPAEKK
jgi:Fe-S oxidoreductase